MRDVESSKDNAAEKVGGDYPPKPRWFLGAVYEAAMNVTAKLERFTSERRGYTYQK